MHDLGFGNSAIARSNPPQAFGIFYRAKLRLLAQTLFRGAWPHASEPLQRAEAREVSDGVGLQTARLGQHPESGAQRYRILLSDGPAPTDPGRESVHRINGSVIVP